MSGPRGVRLRRARPADARAMAAVMRAAVRAAGARFHPPGHVAAWASLPALYHLWAMTAGGERRVVALRGDRIVGWAGWRAAEVTSAFVRPSAARAGIGRALLGRVEREARRRGALSLWVDAARGAEPFYARLGYRGGRAVRVPLPGGGHLAATRMRKRLANTSGREHPPTRPRRPATTPRTAAT